MGRTHTLRRTGGPRRVDQTEVIPRLDRTCHCRPLIRDTVQQLVEGHRGPGKPGRRRPADDHDLFEARGVDPDEALGELVMRDQNLGVGDLESVLEIAALGGEVERCVHAADSVGAEPGADDIWPGRNPDRDVVTDLDADLLQCMTRAPRLTGGFAVRPLSRPRRWRYGLSGVAFARAASRSGTTDSSRVGNGGGDEGSGLIGLAN